MSCEFVRNIHLATAQRNKERTDEGGGIVEHFENIYLPIDDEPAAVGKLGYPQRDLKQFLKGDAF